MGRSRCQRYGPFTFHTEALEQALTADVCCFYVQQPNFYGNFEDGTALGETVHQAGAQYIMGCTWTALLPVSYLPVP